MLRYDTNIPLLGSEAVEAALKLARQYFLELPTPQPQRTRFIARKPSYHGITLGALAAGGHVLRRQPFEPLLPQNISHVSPCYPYRGKENGETDADYVARLAAELDAEFQRVGPENVCAFVAEPVVGAVSTTPLPYTYTFLYNSRPNTRIVTGFGRRLCCSRLLQSHESSVREIRSASHSRRSNERDGSLWNATCMGTGRRNP